MKKAILVFLSVVGVYTAQAQATFTTPADTLFAIMNSDETVDVHNDISPVGTSVTIDWHIIDQNVSASVLNANVLGICDNERCYMYSGSNPGWSTIHSTKEIFANNDELKSFKITLDPSVYPSSAPGPYYVTIMLMDQNSSYSKNITFGIQRFPTSVSSISKNADNISVYPNPAKNDINVVFNANASIKNIAVYNLIGKVVSIYKVNGNSAKLDLSNVPSGIYFMRLVDTNGRVVATRKFTHQ